MAAGVDVRRRERVQAELGAEGLEGLARAGVAALRLVDFDHVSLSSLNRHAVATLDDVGSPKARVLADHVAKVAPFVAVEGLPSMVTAACAEAMLAPVHGRPVDLVVDCIDDVETKAALLETCCRLNIKALSPEFT